jgi:glyoxylate reductase
MGRVFVTRAIPQAGIDTLEAAGHTVDIWPDELPPPRDELAAHLAEADGAMTMVTDKLDNELLAGCPNLRIVANMAVGYDNVEPAVAARNGIWLTNTPGVLAETTADLAFALLLSAARKVSLSERDTRAGGWKTWSPTGYLGQDVFGATLGIVGLGEIGTAMARRARGFSMRTLYCGRTVKTEAERELGVTRVPFDKLLSESDFVTIHVPLTKETRHMFGAIEFGLMRPNAILVNTARGTIVDQAALVDALREGTIAAAGLDVTDPEPLPEGHPLYHLPNVVLTPHIGSASHATRSRMAQMAAENINAVLAGSPPLNPVNKPLKRRQR